MPTETFILTGSTVQWVVPAGVSRVNFDSWGAKGGNNNGGNGGRTSGTFLVSPGQQLTITVGGSGQNSPINNGGLGGFNGGGNGGDSAGDGGAGGGGKTELYLDGTLLAVAGGGGGGGTPTLPGGAGGGLTGTAGVSGMGTTGGGPGTQSAPGLGGSPLGMGGNGGNGGTGGQGGETVDGGGGGGGGFYGGGGGGSRLIGEFDRCGGGGGSGFISPQLLNAQTTADQISPDENGNGLLILTWKSNCNFICPKIIYRCTDKVNTVVNYASVEKKFKCNPPSGSLFPLGTTLVECTPKNNSCTQKCSFKVILHPLDNIQKKCKYYKFIHVKF